MRPMGIISSAAPCEIHKDHRPEPTYTELHHVIPQAWQRFWQPASRKDWPHPGKSPDAPGLWLFDNRTIAVCRTGHGNVHYWLVKIMREIAALAIQTPGVYGMDDPETWRRAAISVRHAAEIDHHQHVNSQDLAWGHEAICRYTQAGGKVSGLIEHGYWGEI